MPLTIRQVHPAFAGEVSGVDLTRPLSRDDIAAIDAGMTRYGVLVFHDQNITDEQQLAFSKAFGVMPMTMLFSVVSLIPVMQRYAIPTPDQGDDPRPNPDPVDKA